MLVNPTLQKLETLKLAGMAQAFKEQLEQPMSDLDFDTRFGFLVEQEFITRDNRRLERLLKQAQLKQKATTIDLNYDKSRGLSKSQILELSNCEWVRHHQNLLITGSTGCGKTYLACALANSACIQGFSSRYYRLSRLFEDLRISKAAGTYKQALAQLTKIDLIILDDWGLASPNAEQIQDLLEIVDDRYQKNSVIITSQLDSSLWHQYLNDATLADAILDRLLHNSVRLELKGESMRKITEKIKE